MLELHKPVPERSEAEIAAEVQHNYRWNFSVNLLDGAFFWFGASFMSSATILPLFVSKLTTAALAIGLLAVFAQASWFLPQLFTANLVERLARKKPVVVNLGLFAERLPVWGLVLAALIAVGDHALARDLLRLLCVARPGRRLARHSLAGPDRQDVPGGASPAISWASRTSSARAPARWRSRHHLAAD